MGKPQLENADAQGALAPYDADFFRWTQDTAELIRLGRFDELDLEHVAEEIQDMGNRDKREVYSRLKVLLVHLLKWEFQPERQGSSWQATILEQRFQVSLVIKNSPSLDRFAAHELRSAYANAVKAAVLETGLSARFPKSCPYTVDEILDDSFLPDPPPSPRA
jgi:hypothetical protein